MKNNAVVRVFSAGVLAAFVGFASSFAIVVQGLYGAGASAEQAASGLMAVSISMGLCGIFLSLKNAMPISAAWSTPGAAFLATLAPFEGGFAVAVGAFMVAGAMTVLAGCWRRLGRAIAAIPVPLASAMLAGVLWPLCLAPVEAVWRLPAQGLPIVLAWAVAARINRALAVPAAVLAAAALLAIPRFIGAEAAAVDWAWRLATPVAVFPEFTFAAVIGIALPLFVITMAAQNITGIAVLRSFGYQPPAASLFRWTGLFSVATAPFGSHAINLAAVTAAICAGDEAHPQPRRRYWSAVVAGLVYIGFGCAAGDAVAFMGMAPPLVIAAVAGLALLGVLATALQNALANPGDREAAIITFLVSVSGVDWLGISAIFWGLLAGGGLYWWDHRRLVRR